MRNVVRDLAASARGLRRNPGFTVTAVACLAVGVGGVTALFSLANGLFLRPLPGIAAPDRLVRPLAPAGTPGPVSYPNFRDLAGSLPSVAELAAFTDRTLNLEAGGEPELIVGYAVSGNYFRTLGVRPVLGRLLGPEEDRPGAPPAAVIGHGLWQRRFGRDPHVLGTVLRINGSPFTVIGVLPPGFLGTFVGFQFDVWVPFATAAAAIPGFDLENRAQGGLELVGRLAPGASLRQAQAEIAEAGRRLARDHPRANRDLRLEALPVTGFDEELRTPALAVVAVLLAVSLLVLLIACSNVANLLLARGLTRGRELAIRRALGAGRRQVAGLLLAESLLLAAVGGALGILLAAWAVELLARFQPPFPVPLALDLGLDMRVLAFAAAAALAAGLAAGLLPALAASRPDLAPAMRDGDGALDGGRRGSRLRDLLVVLQVAASLVLLVGAGLFARSLQKAAGADPGFETRPVAAVPVLDARLLGAGGSEARQLFESILDRVERLPGVEAAAVAGRAPLSFLGAGEAEVETPERRAAGQPLQHAGWDAVSPGYFRALGIPLLAGRGIEARDRAGAPPVAVVNQALARRLWPGGDPIGRRLLRGRGPAGAPGSAGTPEEIEVIEVIGVVPDVKVRSLREEPRPMYYRPFAQEPGPRRTLLVRTAGDPAELAPRIRAAIREVEPRLPVPEVLPLARLLGISLLGQRVAAGTAGVLGALGLLLAAAGLYGVVAFAVVRRTREIGVRMAVGARPWDVLRLVLGQGLRLALAGTAVGILLALAATRALAGMLVGVTASDPATYGAVAVLLIMVALVGSWIPARRATRVDPRQALSSQ